MKYYTRIAAVSSILAFTSCTQQLPDSFRFKQQLETFATQTKVNTKIDLLWVVDNSASMDVVQKRLRDGFSGFASTYLKPYWDIRIAVITTDMYLANAAYHSNGTAYLNRTISGTTNYASAHTLAIKSGGGGGAGNGFFTTLSSESNFYNMTTDPTNSSGVFTGGVKYGYLVPIWGPNYAKLLAGYHDGPIPGLCFEMLPYFFSTSSEPRCQTRNITSDSTATAKSKCTDANNTSSSIDCVNTVRHNDIRSGKPILSTKDGTLTTAQLTDAFKINVSVGSVGSGSERGFQSVSQFLNDNEASGSSSKFFREDSLRGIIFVTDEDDQSMTVANPHSYPHLADGTTSVTQSALQPFSSYYCDLPTVNDTDDDELQGTNSDFDLSNVATSYETNNGYCCTSGYSGCSYRAISEVAGATITSAGKCPVRKFNASGDYDPTCSSGCGSYRVSLCPDERDLVAPSVYKAELDSFFGTLDNNATKGAASYFVSAIVPKKKSSILSLQTARRTVDGNIGGVVKIQATDVPARYLAMVDLVGQGSLSADINDSFNTVLDNIGKTIVSKKGVFPLSRLPTGTEDMTVYRINPAYPAGAKIIKQSEADYVIQGSNLVFQNIEYVLSLTEDDSIAVDYQPKK